MNNIVQELTSYRQEVKETADGTQQVRVKLRQRNPNIVPNLKTRSKEEPNLRSEEGCASEIGSIPNAGFDNIRFRRGSDIVDKKNQIQELNKYQYRVKSQSTCEEYEILSTELGWICSCADHKFRGVICKHLYAIFCILSREQEAKACNHGVIE
jgi:hypothetical protein